ncbi:glycosyltransferase [Salipiger aestuarii]|uniref:glycosyltransferase n=1 Tax=Salipiger aestuarii TaxID=568098 RepID=UPI00025B8B40|nr:glycosyltransferase [Salipiger aestuarii]EIE48646.1 glycosyltransferase [Citreicella sp. 357]KAA8606543.1 glycosyltransferase [Salipiger aestuarii]KAA8610044.1 glycosyltransferase [Salipiger aestuarii]
MSAGFDILVVADPRFSGGSTAALVADVTAMVALGATVGLIFVRSGYLDDARDPENPKALALADLDGVTRLSPERAAHADLAFLHHPLVFFRGIEERLRLTAGRSLIVAHHAPFRADGSMEWDPVATLRRAKRATGLSAWFAPISGSVRTQLASFAPLIRQSSEDWPNVFDPGDLAPTRRALSGPDLTIGRHGRPDPLKFPATGAEIDAALPAAHGIRVRVLGCPTEALIARGARTDLWEVLPFGGEPVAQFLNSLDVFAYHYHPNWLEAFGRTIAEAMLCARPCLLDPRLQATFGNMACYCQPHEVADALRRMTAAPERTLTRADAARETAVRRYAAIGVAARLETLRIDSGDAGRAGAAYPVMRTVRKAVGLYRRQTQGLS